MATQGNDIDILKNIPADKGCEFSSSCLTCPLQKCIEDIPDGRRKLRRKQRDAEIIRLWKEGKKPKELAPMFKLSSRQVLRIIKRGSRDSNA
jgi:hypothetical protein